MTCDEIHGKIMSYVDSEIPASELAEFESHLRGCPACATDALGLLQTKLAIRAAGVRYAPSPEFRLRMEQSMSGKSGPRWMRNLLPRLALATVAAILLIASFTLWVHHSEREGGLSEIADLHVTELASVNPLDVVSTDRHTVKPWFAGKIPFSFNLPELQNSEFTLAGGRVAYFQHSPGAQLLFNLRKHQLSVLIFREPEEPFSHTGTFTATRLAFQIETWNDRGLRYYIVSDAPASDVHALGELLRKAARS